MSRRSNDSLSGWPEARSNLGQAVPKRQSQRHTSRQYASQPGQFRARDANMTRLEKQKIKNRSASHTNGRDAERSRWPHANGHATDAKPHSSLRREVSRHGRNAQPQRIGIHAEQGKKDYEQKERTRTTRQATQTQPALLAADAFVAALGAVPAEDWCRTWAADRTIMLTRTSKKVKEAVDKMRLPAVVRLSRSFWDDASNGTKEAKLEFVLRKLAAITARCRITTLAMPECGIKGHDAERLAGVLAQCTALAHLDLSGNSDFGAAEARGLQVCWGSAGSWCASISGAISLDQPGQRVLQECWGSAHRWLTIISGTIRSAMLGQRALQECWRSAQRWLTSISATIGSDKRG